jgi:hypothetical protein
MRICSKDLGAGLVTLGGRIISTNFGRPVDFEAVTHGDSANPAKAAF